MMSLLPFGIIQFVSLCLLVPSVSIQASIDICLPCFITYTMCTTVLDKIIINCRIWDDSAPTNGIKARGSSIACCLLIMQQRNHYCERKKHSVKFVLNSVRSYFVWTRRLYIFPLFVITQSKISNLSTPCSCSTRQEYILGKPDA